jgi:hypothetical protein
MAEDFIFGNLSSPELKIVDHRSKFTGIQHNHDIYPLNPKKGEEIRLRVRIGPQINVDQVWAYISTDGSQPSGSRGKALNGEALEFKLYKNVWDSFIWGYVQIWEVIIPAQFSDVFVKYQISGWSDGGEEYFADWPNPDRELNICTGAFFRNEPFPDIVTEKSSFGTMFCFKVGGFKNPDWVKEGVFYHILVDRFSPGKGNDWNETENLRDNYGGTIWGIVEKLDYIQALGANVIWLSPIFPSPTYHAYDTTDYLNVEARVGGNEALKALVSEAHSRGMRILLDLVCNHLSNQHPIFTDASKNLDSKYRDWFFFNDPYSPYRSFYGIQTMPQINLSNENAKKWMQDIGRYWIREFDIDGYRLDHANGPGIEFWPEFTAACVEEKSDFVCFGEVVEPPEKQIRYIGKLHGLLDFALCFSIRDHFRKENPKTKLMVEAKRHFDYFKQTEFLLPSFIDNHDMNRFIKVVDGDKDKLKSAAEYQFSLFQPPIIYYGTEVGLEQKEHHGEGFGIEENREPMLWGEEQDKDLLSFYQDLIAKRKNERPWENRV